MRRGRAYDYRRCLPNPAQLFSPWNATSKKQGGTVSYPAFDELSADIELGFVSWKVYMWLQRKWLNHTTARETKILVVQEALHLRPASVITALNWLVAKGYLVEHERSKEGGTRRFTLAWNRAEKPQRPNAA